MEATVQPITRSVLRVSVTLTPEFTWRDSQHGNLQRWLVWVEDPVNEHIYHTETFNLSKKQATKVKHNNSVSLTHSLKGSTTRVFKV